MVLGIEKFKQYFGDYTDQYVLIGGTACSILLNSIGSDFRATKDLDMVLLIEALDEKFANVFGKFIVDGGYGNKQESTGKEQFYRFSNPTEDGFPVMIELFSGRSKNFKLHFGSILTPIHITENVASLSAILLNDAYYQLIIEGKSIVDGYSVLSMEYNMLFKMKAWMDLCERKQSGEGIDSYDINKHKNDVFRLLINISPSNKISISREIHEDVKKFTDKIIYEKVDLKNLGIRSIGLPELIDRIGNLYYCIASE